MEIPWVLGRHVAWLLTVGADHPDDREACSRALDIAIAQHRAKCADPLHHS